MQNLVPQILRLPFGFTVLHEDLQFANSQEQRVSICQDIFLSAFELRA